MAPDSFILDRVNNQLLHGLMIDGRAPFSLLSEVIGTSEQNSGPANLTTSVVCRSEAELYALLTDEIGAIDSIHSAEVSPVLRRVKQAGTVLRGTRLQL